MEDDTTKDKEAAKDEDVPNKRDHWELYIYVHENHVSLAQTRGLEDRLLSSTCTHKLIEQDNIHSEECVRDAPTPLVYLDIATSAPHQASFLPCPLRGMFQDSRNCSALQVGAGTASNHRILYKAGHFVFIQ